MSASRTDSDPGHSRVVQVQRLQGAPAFADGRAGWWGYEVSVPGKPPFAYWVLGADYLEIGGGFVQREAVAERLGDGRDPFDCSDPHPAEYYDDVWDAVLVDLHRSGHPSLE